MTMVFDPHEMGFSVKISDKLIFLANGLIGEQGAPKILFSQPKFEKLKNFLSTWSERNSEIV